MSGYLDFKETGVPAIDKILTMLEAAGNGYHHTEMWGEKDGDEPSYIDRIQAAADEAAAAFRNLENQS